MSRNGTTSKKKKKKKRKRTTSSTCARPTMPHGRPSLADEDLFNKPKRHDLSAPERAQFKRQQREVVRTVFVRQDAQGRMSETIEGLDAEQFYREKWLELKAKRDAEAAAA